MAPSLWFGLVGPTRTPHTCWLTFKVSYIYDAVSELDDFERGFHEHSDEYGD
jgi:hypothetical protein